MVLRTGLDFTLRFGDAVNPAGASRVVSEATIVLGMHTMRWQQLVSRYCSSECLVGVAEAKIAPDHAASHAAGRQLWPETRTSPKEALNT